MIRLPSRPHAEQVARSIHDSLAPCKVDLELRRDEVHDGRQEWFVGHAQDAALRMLARIPLQAGSRTAARVLPLTSPAPSADASNVETGLQDAWWRVEDILARLALHCAITVDAPDRRGGHPTVTVHDLKSQAEAHLAELCRAARDSGSYRCWRDGRALTFVQALDWLGDDLVLSFTPLPVLERWDDGPEMAGQVRSFMAHLQRRSRVRRSG